MTGALDLYGDHPVKANLDVVASLGGLLSEVATAASSIKAMVNGISGQADASVWSGESADAFRSKLDDLPDLIAKVERSYSDAAASVTTFLASAGQTERDAVALGPTARSTTDESSAAAVADPNDPATAARVDAADQAVREMTAKVAVLHDDYQRAETTLVNALDTAKHEGIEPNSFWHKLVTTVEDWAGTIALVLAVVVIVLVVVLVVFLTAGAGLGVLAALALALEALGPLLTVLTAVSVVHFAAAVDHKVQYGDDGDAAEWWQIGLEGALIFVPMGAGKLGSTLGRSGGAVAEGTAAAGQGGGQLARSSQAWKTIGGHADDWWQTADLLKGDRGAIDPASIARRFTDVEGVADDLPEMSGILRDATRGKGNFGIGSATASQADDLGRAWVGSDFRVASDGKTLISSDGLRQYRPPSFKPRLGRIQANFETRYWPEGQWQGNGHLDIVE